MSERAAEIAVQMRAMVEGWQAYLPTDEQTALVLEAADLLSSLPPVRGEQETEPELKLCSCVGHCRGREGLSQRFTCALDMKRGKVPFAAPVRAEQIDLATELQHFGNRLALAQKDLPLDAMAALRENLWQLYESTEAAEDAKPSAQSEEMPMNAQSTSEQEQCAYCQHWYARPVSLHHTTEECDANGGAQRLAVPAQGVRADLTKLKQACRVALDVFHNVGQLTGHSGDEESGQCDADCFACSADAALAQLSAALEGAAKQKEGDAHRPLGNQ